MCLPCVISFYSNSVELLSPNETGDGPRMVWLTQAYVSGVVKPGCEQELLALRACFFFFSPNWAPQVVLRMWTGLAARLLHWWQLCSIIGGMGRIVSVSWAPVLWSGSVLTEALLTGYLQYLKSPRAHGVSQGTWGHVLIDVLFSQECHSWQVIESLVSRAGLGQGIWSNSGILLNLFCFFTRVY